jgi:hypothetical protein
MDVVFIWSLNRCATGTAVHTALVFYIVFCSFLVSVSWSFVLCFDFPSLEFSVACRRSVNLALIFLNHENGDFSILMRDIFSNHCGGCSASRSDQLGTSRFIFWEHKAPPATCIG